VVKFALACLVVAACRFVHGLGGTPGGGDAGDAPMIGSDALRDGTVAVSCLPKWKDGSVQLGSAAELSQLVVGNYDDDPFVTPDDLTLYFDGMGSASEDIFASTRARAGDPWGTPAVVPSLSSTADESKTSITGDGLDAFISSTIAGGVGNLDVWEAMRADTQSAFGMWSETNLANVNTPGSDYDAAISFDGEHLYYAPSPTAGAQEIYVAARNLDGTFATPVELTELADPGGASTADPAPSRDELVLVFSSQRTGSGVPMGRNMWYATRASTSDAFSPPVQIPDINTDNDEGGPELSDDGCTLYFSSDRGSDGQTHVYYAQVM